jgi:hypothetical protein
LPFAFAAGFLVVSFTTFFDDLLATLTDFLTAAFFDAGLDFFLAVVLRVAIVGLLEFA